MADDRDIVERLRATAPLPVCPFDRRSPDYWTAGENGAPCPVCGGTEDGPDKCRGADTRIMDKAAEEITRLRTALASTRRGALEEAAKVAEQAFSYNDNLQRSAGFPTFGQRIAASIRALADKGGGDDASRTDDSRLRLPHSVLRSGDHWSDERIDGDCLLRCRRAFRKGLWHLGRALSSLRPSR